VIRATSGFAAKLDFNFTVTKGVLDAILLPGSRNNYTVLNRQITAFDAVAVGSDSILDINSDPSGQFNPFPPAVDGTFGVDCKFLNGAGTTIAFATDIVVEDPEAPAVPLPAGGVLLLTGFVALRRWKTRAT
jgi:hypothetical protein